MPELAEVEFYRRRWDVGLKARITAVELHAQTRVFRGQDAQRLRRALRNQALVASAAHGKQLLFRFSGDGWLGVHLGMTGELFVGEAGLKPGTHDHLVLRQSDRTLVFRDPRQFGRVLFHSGPTPAWWSNLPAPLLSPGFSARSVQAFLHQHARAPVKAVLLMQEGFPGIGNWMADEILWRCRIHPATPAGALSEAKARGLWRVIRFVARGALRTVVRDFRDPPAGWLFHARWRDGGKCPRHGQPLIRDAIGGRTTAWCPLCQGRGGFVR
jgi:formamidopyrimidine-DNA glycosylase